MCLSSGVVCVAAPRYAATLASEGGQLGALRRHGGGGLRGQFASDGGDVEFLQVRQRRHPGVVRICAVEFGDDLGGFAIGHGWSGIGVGRHSRPDQFAIVLQVVALLADLLRRRARVAMPRIDGVGVTEPIAQRSEVG